MPKLRGPHNHQERHDNHFCDIQPIGNFLHGLRLAGCLSGVIRLRQHAIGMDGFGDIFNAMLSQILEPYIQFILCLLIYTSGNADASRIRQTH